MMLRRYNNFVQRLITGILGSALMVGALIYSEWGHFAIFFTLCLLALLEFYNLSAFAGIKPQRKFGTFCGMVIFCLSFFVARGDLSVRYFFLLVPLISCIYTIKLYKDPDKQPFTGIAYTLLGIFYIAIPVSLLHVAAYRTGAYNFELVVGFLFILWANDSGAYFAGTLFGKRQLFANISPKKSWEGVFGGCVLATVFALIMASLFHSLALQQWLIVDAFIVVGGVYGDLVESLLKRSFNIKDSGESLPGHGGFLDRFDGLFMAAPFIVALLELI